MLDVILTKKASLTFIFKNKNKFKCKCKHNFISKPIFKTHSKSS